MKLTKIVRLAETFDWNAKPEQEQLKLVRGNGDSIKYINNPSEAVQLAAVKQSSTAIYHIKNPSEAVQIETIIRNSDLFHYITTIVKDVSEAVQLVAVKADSWNINSIPNPSEAVQLAAVRKHHLALLDIKNPTQATLKLVFTDRELINDESEYKSMVNHFFKNNTLLTKKWLRYGETMRTQQ